MPTSKGVCKLVAGDALSNWESNSHCSLLYVMTVAFDVSVTVICACLLVECTVNSSRRATLIAIEGEIQPTTEAVTRCRCRFVQKALRLTLYNRSPEEILIITKKKFSRLYKTYFIYQISFSPWANIVKWWNHLVTWFAAAVVGCRRAQSDKRQNQYVNHSQEICVHQFWTCDNKNTTKA